MKKYLNKFQKLRIDRAHGAAPHKPILLLTIIECIIKGEITTNKIFITPELVAGFKENWASLVSSNHTPSFTLPFYHLKSEQFWRLIPNQSYEKLLNTSSTLRSFKTLILAVNHAEIDIELFDLLSDRSIALIFINILLDTYFQDTKMNYKLFYNELSILKEEENNILNNVKNLDINQDEEATFIRGGLFKKIIPKLYNFSCCISGLKISTLGEISILDACHIVPFSVSGDDTISNGIALCPNLHRAFDGGIITIDENFKVLVSEMFFEQTVDHTFSIKSLHGRTIILPPDREFYPNISNFLWHKNNIFKTV